MRESLSNIAHLSSKADICVNHLGKAYCCSLDAETVLPTKSNVLEYLSIFSKSPFSDQSHYWPDDVGDSDQERTFSKADNFEE